MGRSDERVVDEAKRVDDEAKRLNFQMKVWVGQMKGWVWQMKVWVGQMKGWLITLVKVSNLDKVTGRNPKKLADWGISIDDTPKANKAQKPSIKIFTKKNPTNSGLFGW